MVLVPYVSGDEVCSEPYVLGFWEWVVEVEVFYIYARGFGSRRGDDMIEQAFYCYQVRNFCRYISMEVNAVSSDGAANLVWVRLLFPVVGNNSYICRSFVIWHVMPVYEGARVGAVDRMGWVLLARVSLE